MSGRGGLLFALAIRDCREEWPSAASMLLGIAAVLVPILLLLSIRAGIVGTLRDELESSPQSRELLTVGEPVVTTAFLAQLRKDPAASFVAPRTRLLAAAAILRSADLLNAAEADMVPSGPGDPMVTGAWQRDSVALSETLARTLGARKKDRVLLILERKNAAGEAQSQRLMLQVLDIVDHTRSRGSQSLAYLPSTLIDATEVWRENPAVPDLAAAMQPQQGAANRKYAGLRMFARDVDAVDGLRAKLAQAGIETQSRAADIRLVQRLSRSMSIFIGAIGSFMAIGLVLALGSIQWGWVERKRYDYAYLRLLGLDRSDLALLPVIQAMMIVVPAAVLAVALTSVAQVFINRLFAGQVSGMGIISRMPIAESALLIAAAFLIAAAGAFFAARNAARVSPIIALRGY